MEKKYDYIVWDFNGTIIDDVDLCFNLLNKMLVEQGHKPVTKERYLEIFEFPIIEYYKKAGFTFEGYTFHELSVEFIKDYQPASFKCNFCKDSLETVKELENRGYENICISASQKDNIYEQMEVMNIRQYFKHVIGIKDIHGASKVDIAVKWRDFVGWDKKVLMIGDTTHDSEVAEAISADCYLVAQGHQNKRRLIESPYKTLGVLDTAAELLKLL